MGRTFAHVLRLIAGTALVAGTLLGSPPRAEPVAEPAAAVARSSGHTRPIATSFDPVTFDDFDRTVADGWGTSSSGVAWTDDSFRQNGITSQDAGNATSVDGLNGRMDLGVGDRSSCGPGAVHGRNPSGR
jgi:acyl dehydratase